MSELKFKNQIMYRLSCGHKVHEQEFTRRKANGGDCAHCIQNNEYPRVFLLQTIYRSLSD